MKGNVNKQTTKKAVVRRKGSVSSKVKQLDWIMQFIIRMNPEANNGFIREWSVVSMPPERHVAYAVQWFALALLVVILFVVLSMKKKT